MAFETQILWLFIGMVLGMASGLIPDYELSEEEIEKRYKERKERIKDIERRARRCKTCV